MATPNLGLTYIVVGQGSKENTINENYDLLDAQSSVKGTAFPGTPATNTRFYRTDRGIEYYYNGTRWLSTQVFNEVLPQFGSPVAPYTATIVSPERLGAPWQGVYDLWLGDFQFVFHVVGGTALSASHKWVSVIGKRDSAGTSTTVATVIIDSGSLSVWRSSTVAIGALLGTTHFTFDITHTKTGTPGNLYSLPRLVYRLVG